jgi:hypothetical protein
MRAFSTISVALFFAALFEMSACDNTISPLADGADRIVAIYGMLDARVDTQYVRVGSLRPTVLREAPEIHNLRVRSRTTGGGTSVDWFGVEEPDSATSAGHLFGGVFRPESDTEYELEVWSDDEVLASATTILPVQPRLLAALPTGDSLNLTQAIQLEDIFKKPLTMSVNYEVYAPGVDSTQIVTIEYDQPGEIAGSGWFFYVFLARDRAAVRRQLGLQPTGADSVGLKRVSAVFSLPSEEYEHPDDESNLHSALGFFGSVGKYDASWVLKPKWLRVVGYRDRQSPD